MIRDVNWEQIQLGTGASNSCGPTTSNIHANYIALIRTDTETQKVCVP